MNLRDLARQLVAAVRQAIEDPAAGRQSPSRPSPPPRRKYTQYAQEGERADGLTPDQAALTAVRRRGLPCGILDTAMAEGLGVRHIRDACLVLKHAPDLAGTVMAGERSLFQAAYIARLRRDAPGLAAKVEARLTGDTWKDSHLLRSAWGKAREREAARRPAPASLTPTRGPRNVS